MAGASRYRRNLFIIGGAAPASLLEKLADQLPELRPSVRQDFGPDRLRLSTLGERSAALGASALPILACDNIWPCQRKRSWWLDQRQETSHLAFPETGAEE